MIEKYFRSIFALLSLGFLLSACASTSDGEMCATGHTPAPKRSTSKPYAIKGVWYYPQQHYEYEEVGMASYYGGGDVFHGRPTATGKIFSMNGITAAHKTVPLPCIAEVTNLENGRRIKVEVNDRGPFVDGRIIDVSRRVAQLLGFEGKGTAKVRVRTLVSESLALNNLPPFPASDSNATAFAEAFQPAEKITPAASGGQKTIDSIILAAATEPDLPLSSPRKSRHSSPSPPLRPQARPKAVQTVSYTTSPSRQTRHRGAKRGIYVDVGSCRTASEAQVLAQKLGSQGQTTAVPTHIKEKQLFAVRIGPLPSMAQADLVVDQLASTGHPGSRIVINY